MQGRAYFFNNINNIRQLMKKNKHAKEKGYSCQKYRVIKSIELEKKEFSEFLKNISNSQQFLSDITSMLTFSSEGEYLCMAIENSSSEIVILACTFQYCYPKYVAVLRRDEYGEKVY